MYCLKCGKETGSERVFCANCLDSMEKYPVKPGTHISLPNRPPVVVVKKTSRRHRTASPEEQIRSQRRTIRVLSFLLAVVSILLIFCAFELFSQDTPERPDPASFMGQNYTIDPEN